GSVGPNCAQQPVCCEGNDFNGLVSSFASQIYYRILIFLSRSTLAALPSPSKYLATVYTHTCFIP
ncbi:hypothetical protein M422DRAFT_159500, partial [Sphaerobolus stellatus SS14]